jgi:membrane protein DedA with SNARE-associated domain
MLTGIENASIDFVRSLFDTLSWFGIFLAMTIESAGIPLPSEVIMPLAGWLLVSERDLGWGGIILASLVGAAGNLAGSTIAYAIGAVGGRPLIERWGRWVLITHEDLDRADLWFYRRGAATTFIGRLLPVVRTFISFPAGIARMPFGRFAVYTFVGAFLWCIPLTALGEIWGPKWESFRDRAKYADDVIVLVLVLLVVWYFWHKYRQLRAQPSFKYGRDDAASEEAVRRVSTSSDDAS